METTKQKICIVGGLGHVGSSLIQKLQYFKNTEVTVVDNLSTQRYCSLYHFPKDFIFIESDFIKVDPSPYDIIIHLAAKTDAAGSLNNKEAVYQTNVEDTIAFLSKCLDKRIIFPSSTSVYGSKVDVVTEATPVNPQSPYAESKLEIEKYLYVLGNAKNCIIPRFGTITGVSMGMRFHTAVNKFCYQARFNQPLTVWKENYEMVRPYLSIVDAVNFIIAACTMLRKETGIYNIVTVNSKLKDIVDYVNKMKPVQTNMIDTPLLNQFSYDVSNKKSKNVGFKYVGNIFDDINKTLGLLGVE
ncbi:MAG TPA: SDR family oxidoreductase [Patescibacteria group bacterium]|nr:SDR family oxidoreductase [Patescibacteria group bacterium]